MEEVGEGAVRLVQIREERDGDRRAATDAIRNAGGRTNVDGRGGRGVGVRAEEKRVRAVDEFESDIWLGVARGRLSVFQSPNLRRRRHAHQEGDQRQINGFKLNGFKLNGFKLIHILLIFRLFFAWRFSNIAA